MQKLFIEFRKVCQFLSCLIRINTKNWFINFILARIANRNASNQADNITRRIAATASVNLYFVDRLNELALIELKGNFTKLFLLLVLKFKELYISF